MSEPGVSTSFEQRVDTSSESTSKIEETSESLSGNDDYDEYCTQFFGFLPQSFINGIYNAVCDYLKDGIAALNESILRNFKDSVSEEELHKISCQQAQIALDRLNAKFDKAEVYLKKNVFSIPSHIVLPEDQLHAGGAAMGLDMKSLDNEIQEHIDRIVAVKYANSQLRERLVVVDSLQKQFDDSEAFVKEILLQVSAQSQDFVQTCDNLKCSVELMNKCDLKE